MWSINYTLLYNNCMQNHSRLPFFAGRGLFSFYSLIPCPVLGFYRIFSVSNKELQVPSIFSGFSLQYENFITSTVIYSSARYTHFLYLCFPSCTHFQLLSIQTLNIMLSLWLYFRLFPQHLCQMVIRAMIFLIMPPSVTLLPIYPFMFLSC